MKRILLLIFLITFSFLNSKAQNLMEFQKTDKKLIEDIPNNKMLYKTLKIVDKNLSNKATNEDNLIKKLAFENMGIYYSKMNESYSQDSLNIKQISEAINDHFKTYKNESGTLRNTVDSLMFISFKNLQSEIQTLDTLKILLKEFNAKKTEFNALKIDESIIHNQNIIFDEIKNIYQEFESKSKKLNENYKKNIIPSIKLAEKATSDKESQTKFISSLPQINNLFGNGGFIIPSISILGIQNFNRGAVTGNIKILSSGVKPAKNDGWRSFPIIENTIFGIQANLLKGLYARDANYNKVGGMKNLGFQASFNYLLKNGIDSISNLPDTSSISQKNYNYGLAHISIGVRYVAIKNIIELYGDYNYQDILTGQNLIKDGNPVLYENRNKMGFFNTGIQAKISADKFNIKELTNNYLLLDFNFIWTSDFLRNIGSVNKASQDQKALVDKVLIVLKISLKI